MDVSQSRAESNVANVSASKVDIQQCTVIKKFIQDKKPCLVKNHKRRSNAYIVYGFCRTKEEMLNPQPSDIVYLYNRKGTLSILYNQGIVYFIQPYKIGRIKSRALSKIQGIV